MDETFQDSKPMMVKHILISWNSQEKAIETCLKACEFVVGDLFGIPDFFEKLLKEAQGSSQEASLFIDNMSDLAHLADEILDPLAVEFEETPLYEEDWDNLREISERISDRVEEAKSSQEELEAKYKKTMAQLTQEEKGAFEGLVSQGDRNKPYKDGTPAEERKKEWYESIGGKERFEKINELRKKAKSRELIKEEKRKAFQTGIKDLASHIDIGVKKAKAILRCYRKSEE